jgi:hypothetical protein
MEKGIVARLGIGESLYPPEIRRLHFSSEGFHMWGAVALPLHSFFFFCFFFNPPVCAFIPFLLAAVDLGGRLSNSISIFVPRAGRAQSYVH